jgi:hypothetical protein
MKPLSTLDIALDYLPLHPTRYVFPMKREAKFPPLVQDNLDGNCSNDPEQVKKWHAKWPGCNWGLAHKKSGVLVVDVDTNQAKGKVGQDTFDELDILYGFPETEVTTTPSGGKHYIYEGEHIFALGENGLGKDIDSPNYSLLPGCKLKDGSEYVSNGKVAVPTPEWIYDKLKRGKERLADAGVAVVDLDQPKMVEWAIDYLRNDAEPAIEGKLGDFQTLKVAMSLRDNGISESLAVDLLNEYYNDRCVPPWDIEGLTAKVRNAYDFASLSKLGGKTAEADFADDDAVEVAASIKPKGDKKKSKKEAKDRAASAEREASKSDDEKERLSTLIDLQREWVWVADIERFVKRENPDIRWKTTAFNATFKYIDEKKKVADILFSKKKDTIPRCHSVVYMPTRPEFLERGTLFNLYRPSEVVPFPGDTTIWREHMEYLFPNETDRSLVLNWLAWLLQNIALKPKHALLIQGPEQGTGKSFIAEVMQLLLGSGNVQALTENDLQGDFNGWALKTKLVWVEELRTLDRGEVKRKLHPLITQERVRINEKNVPGFQINNCFGVFAMTNDDAALQIDNTDRRYLVVRTDAKPRNSQKWYGADYEPDYYVKLYGLLKDPAAIAAIANELLTRDLGNYNGQSSAPETQAKTDMIESGLSDLESWMMENEGNYPLNGKLIQIQDVIDVLPKRLDHAARLSQTIASILKHKFQARLAGQFRLSNGRRVRLYALRGAVMGVEGWDKVAAKTYETERANAANRSDKNDSAEADFSGA